MDNTLHHYLGVAEPYLQSYEYLAVFLGVMIESFGVPAPGQSLVMAGALLAAQGEMRIVIVLALAWSAAVLGDNLGYAIGRYGGRRLLLHHGRYLGMSEARLTWVESFFDRYGGGIVVVARFVDVLRSSTASLPARRACPGGASLPSMPWVLRCG